MGKYLEWCYTAINNTQGNAHQGAFIGFIGSCPTAS